MKAFGVIILSFEEVDGLSDLLPWKAVDADQAYAAGGPLSSVPWQSYVVLSTCNRFELIYNLGDGVSHEQVQREVMRGMPTLPPAIAPRFEVGRHAVDHLVRLAAGLESLVLGESEIKAQMVQAKHAAREAGRLDSSLLTMLQHVFREGREIRNQVPMHRLPLSLPALASRKIRAQATRGAAEGKPAVLIIGSGPMSRQAAEYVAKWSPRVVWVNRTVEKVSAAAGRLGAEVHSFEAMLATPEALGPLAGVVTATSHPDAFLNRSLLERSVVADGGLTIVDLALPPDVDPDVATMEGVGLISLDSLRAELEANRARRAEAAADAQTLVLDALVRIEARLIATQSGPILKRLQRRVRDRSRRHLEDLLEHRLAHLNARDRRALYDWAIRSNREMNRIHREGVEGVLQQYYAGTSRTG